MNKRRPIKNKLRMMFLAVSVVSLILASLAGVISLVRVHENDEDVLLSQVKQNIYENMILNAEMASSELKRYSDYASYLSRQLHDVYTHSQDYMPTESNDLMMFGNLGRIWQSIADDKNNNVAYVFAASKKGSITVYPAYNEGYNYFDSSWYGQLMEVISPDIFPDTLKDENIITFACPFYGSDEKIAGVTGICISAADIYRTLIPDVYNDPDEDKLIFLIGEEGNIISYYSGSNSPEVPKMLKDYADIEPNIVNRIKLGQRGISRTSSGMYYAYAPIKSTDWKICLRISEEEVLRPIRLVYDDLIFVLSLFIAAIIAIIVMVVIAARKFSEKFTAPIIALSEDVNTMAEWKLDHSAKVHDNDEIGDLAVCVNELAISLKEYMIDFGKVTGEKEQIKAELKIAAQIQADMLPKIFPAFPDRNEFDIYATMNPAKEVGGDFYDFFMIDDNHLAMVIADVSGKGVPAALFMVIAKTLIKNRAQMGGRPSDILFDVNNQLCEGNDAMLFVTVWLGILNLSTGTVAASNAGHELPAIMHKGKKFSLVEEEDHSPALAVMQDIKFGENEFTLEPGSMIYLYTDGVAEATDTDEELYGTDRMLDALNQHTEDSTEDILIAMRHDVDAFVKEAPQFDDITMICLQYFGIRDELIVPAEINRLEEVMMFVNERLTAWGCHYERITEIEIAVEEIFVNIASYAYEPDRKGTVKIGVKRKGSYAEISFSDKGKPYNPLKRPDPDIDLPPEKRKPGGLGIYIVKESMDSVKYRFVNGKNILTIKKSMKAPED